MIMVGKKKNKFNLRKQYLDAWNYIKECSRFIWIIIAIFFIFGLIGFFSPTPVLVEEKILEFISDLLDKTEGLSSGEMIWFIFSNNIQSSFFGLILGIFFGIFPLFVSLLNGYLLGFVAEKSVEAAGVLSLWRILPHGVFELTAVFISLGMGLKLGTFIFVGEKIKSFKRFLYESINVFIFVVFPLLVLAAIIEGLLITLLR